MPVPPASNASADPASAPTSGATTPAQLAKAALRRMAEERLEPTPENYRIAYEAEAGIASPAPTMPGALDDAGHDDKAEGSRWSSLITRIVKGAERGGRQWTSARKKDSLQRVLEGSRASGQRLHQRLSQLVASWDSDKLDAPPIDEPAQDPASTPATASTTVPPSAWGELAGHALTQLQHTVLTALPDQDANGAEARALVDAALQPLHTPDASVWQDSAPDALRQHVSQACEQAQRIIEHRQQLVGLLTQLCHALTDSLTDLSEDDSWVQGQCVLMRHQIDEGLNSRGVRHVQQVLGETRERQRQLKRERAEAQAALKHLIHTMLQELAELGSTTDRFQNNLGRYVETIGAADSLESLAGLVREMVEDSRTVQNVVAQTQSRLHTEHSRAVALTERVRELEAEIRQLSDEVSTDPLTQIANRRGMMRAFEAEQARVERQGSTLAIGLLDVDNFKRLNDQLGHQTGDEALKFLARRVSECLRPVDVVARYGGEEFVVMLPETTVDDAQQVLTRLQRTLSAEFFIHDEKKVFITFSAGVTQYRAGESIEVALDRADVALYEAKRTGKNRTCMA